MKTYSRSERVANKIHAVITELISKKMADPRIEMATITQIITTSDLRIADVYISVFGSKKRIKDAVEGFKQSKKFIKKKIAPKLGLKYMPDLRFFYDDSFDKAAKLDRILKSVLKPSNSSDKS